ncbi:hypothetical protein ONS95_015024 [Cadophora gregata]|uniref:uncharacterized protein n=1 Tax=Cadophora gregata TaxID=51156 RepID=UPI0026DC6262|nr:uncharacterized protein ONS95_015024 [Cadophora gregata]KAK0108692.1 hypothetical protein ONS95_015024 [Cadophora gregata]
MNVTTRTLTRSLPSSGQSQYKLPSLSRADADVSRPQYLCISTSSSSFTSTTLAYVSISFSGKAHKDIYLRLQLQKAAHDHGHDTHSLSVAPSKLYTPDRSHLRMTTNRLSFVDPRGHLSSHTLASKLRTGTGRSEPVFKNIVVLDCELVAVNAARVVVIRRRLGRQRKGGEGRRYSM